MDEGTAPVTAEDAGARPGRRFELWWLAAGTAVVLAAVIAIAAVVAAVRGSFGDRMATATALPADTAVYVSMDLEGVARFDRLLTTFESVAADAGVEPGTDVLDLLDEMVLAELGLSTEDFEPWIGRDVGVGILDLDLDLSGEIIGPPQVVVAATVRNEAAADAFMPKMVAAMEAQGMAVNRDAYGEVAMWEAEPDPESFGVTVPVVMARSDDMMLLASDRSAMRRAIDAQQGDALRDADAFTALVGELPGDRAFTMYLGRDMLAPFADLLSDPALGTAPGQLEDMQELLDAFGGAAMALTIDDTGLRLDVVQAFAAESGFNAAAQPGSERVAAALPQDTFLYFGLGPWDVQAGWEQIMTSLAAGGATGDLAELEAQLGIDIERDIVAVLTGELGFGLFPSAGGVFSEIGGPPLGGLALLGVTDPEAAAATLERVNRLLADSGAPLVEEGGLFSLSPDGENAIVYGISGDFFVAGTDAGTVSRVGGDGEGSLVERELWGEARDALDGAAPALFVDIAEALDVFGAPPDVRRALAPLRAVTAGAETGDGLTKAAFVALIDWADE